MNSQSVIEYKIRNLINILLEKGVQPEELISNIWRKQYNSFNIFKENDNIIVCSICFYDNDIKINMIYKYDENKNLTRIEEIVGDTITILWDREDYIRPSINDICDLIRVYSNIDSAKSFIRLLPKDIRVLIEYKLSEIA